MRKTEFLLLLTLWIPISCTSVKQSNEPANYSFDHLPAVGLGVNKESAIAKVGKPESHTDEAIGGGSFRVDESQGLFIGMRRNLVFAVIWADSKLTKIWIKELIDKCSAKS